MENEKMEVPVWEKLMLTVDEAAALTGVGRDKLYELSLGEASDCVLWIGRKRLFKRKKLEEFFERSYSI